MLKFFLFLKEIFFLALLSHSVPKNQKEKKGFLSFRNLTRQLINSREKKKQRLLLRRKKKKTTKIRSLFFFFFQKCFSLPKGNVSFEKCFVISRKKKTLIEKRKRKTALFGEFSNECSRARVFSKKLIDL